MQGLITIDFGNSNPHAGLFQKINGKWNHLKTVPWDELSIYLQQLNMTPDNTQMVLCEVKSREDQLAPWIEQGYLLTRVKDYWKGGRFAGMPVQYANSLGEDRLIEAFYCYKNAAIPTLIVDAGTYVTLDVINSSGFAGGYIIPGQQAYYQSFLQAEQLKNVQLHPKISSDLPCTTADAMVQSYRAFAELAREMITTYQIQKLVLTGGQGAHWAQYFEKAMPGVVLQISPDLLHLALHYWMTTQIEPL